MLARAFTGLAVTAMATLGAGLLGASPAHAAGPAKVSVVHGIPGQAVDVYVNGSKTLDNFQPSTVAGPLDLPEGKYDIVLTKPGEAITSPVLKVDQATVPGDANISLVAHLNAGGQPTLTPFVNDTGKLTAGKARLVVRHTAAAPAVDVRAGGQPVFRGLENPKEATADLAAGTVSADVVLAGTTNVAIPATNLALSEGTATIVFAVGSASGNTLGVVAQKIDALHSVPGGVPSGSGGLAYTRTPWWLYASAAVGLVLALGSGIRLARAGNRG